MRRPSGCPRSRLNLEDGAPPADAAKLGSSTETPYLRAAQNILA